MKNKEFYAFCRDNRETADSLAKREALQSVYKFMFECGVSKVGVMQYIERMIRDAGGRGYDIQAFQWVLSVFEGPSLTPKTVPDGQTQMFKG